ncbi:sialic acid synthase [Staphylococcus sp. SQ8-PEA]|uniref:Sialic acid synthase n=1 Tax=Staphylococcus marylandisciuri TaxID=2981529 RepID=A0ABT2QMA2_9STAP|nr:IucA/IucC family protein [Staphylococcus marylandisciuri]MCU5745112.1 sialic acid synthase [Staphylococcus marylandisciuri]
MNNKIKLDNEELTLTPTEQEAHNYLSHVSSSWLRYFTQSIMVARDKITQRIIASVYRENIVGTYYHSKIIPLDDCPRQLKSYLTSDLLLALPFERSKVTLYANITSTHAFDRIEVQGPFYTINHLKHFRRVKHSAEILTYILTEHPDYKNTASDQFESDLENSTTNLALSLSYSLWKADRDSRSMYEKIADSTDPFLTSEQSVIEGHPLHPGAKLRKGMSIADTIRYSSEFSQPIHLKFMLMSKDKVKLQTIGNSYNANILRSFPQLEASIIDRFGEDILDDYVVLAMHPWQYQYALEQDLKLLVPEVDYILINYSPTYYSGLSFRTLMPMQPSLEPHIKLPVNVHITGEIRTLSEQTTFNGPLVTEMLRNIMNNDSLFSSAKFNILDEFAGAHYFDTQLTGEIQTRRSEELGTLYRTNVYQLLDAPSDSLPVISSSLVISSIGDKTPLIISLLKQYQTSQNSEIERSTIITWFEKYARLLLSVTLSLYVKYGISMEAHLQNTIAVFNKDGEIKKIIIRDFEGLRIDSQQLDVMGHSTDHFHDKSLILCSDPTTVFNKMFYSTIQNHLGELVLTLSKYDEDPTLEHHLWSTIRILIDEQITRIGSTMPEQQQRIEDIKSIIFAHTIDYKCVTAMRLIDEADDYIYRKVENPLSDS